MVGAKPTALKAMLARGVTAVALTEWLEGSPKAALRALADVVVVVSAAAPAPPTPLPLPRCCPAADPPYPPTQKCVMLPYPTRQLSQILPECPEKDKFARARRHATVPCVGPDR